MRIEAMLAALALLAAGSAAAQSPPPQSPPPRLTARLADYLEMPATGVATADRKVVERIAFSPRPNAMV